MENNLTGKQKLFVQAYLAFGERTFFNATGAARAAGYSGSNEVLGVVGHRNLKKAKIRGFIDAYLHELGYNSETLIRRWITVAQNDLSLHIDSDGLDLKGLKEAGLGFLIKGVRYSAKGDPIYDLRDPEKAEEQLAKALGMFIERREITGGGGGPLRVEYTNDWRSPSTVPAPRPTGDSQAPGAVQAGDGRSAVAEDHDGDAPGD